MKSIAVNTLGGATRRLTLVLAALAIVVASIGIPTRTPSADALSNVVAEWSGSTLLGRSQNSPHRWGSCDVQDYNGGSWGWYMRVGRPFSYDNFHVHHGMLAGWTNNGGAAGSLGCPLSEEYPFAGGARQSFQGGVLFWRNGMSAAQVTGRKMADAIGFAVSFVGKSGKEACKAANLGSNGYVGGTSGGQCRQFVNCVVYKVLGVNPALGFAATGAVQITDRTAVRPGDIIQTSAPHTAIVLANLGGGRLEVVDSNYVAWETVGTHTWQLPSGAEIWRYNG